jgi:molybdenum cofactor guanylyltransferase
VVGLWSMSLLETAEKALAAGVSAMTRFAELQKSAVVDFPSAEIGGKRFDPFFNVNTPADVATAERLLAALASSEPARG